MGTRCVVTFKDEHQSFSVYQHWDGNPAVILEELGTTLKSGKAWPLPRFEASEFAAAFIAANKDGSGNVYLTSGPKAHSDLSYEYVVTCNGPALAVKWREAGTKRWHTQTIA